MRKKHKHNYLLECRKWGFKRWGFKEIRGYLRKKAFFLRFLDFPGALQALRKRAKKAEKADFGRFPGRAARHCLNPHLLHPHLRQPKFGPHLLWTSRPLRPDAQRPKSLDELQITHLICARLKYDLYDFFRGCLGPFIYIYIYHRPLNGPF